MSVSRVVSRLGGAARRETLLAAGLSVRQIRAALAEGSIQRPYRGCYALPDASREAVMAALYRARPTCVTLLAQLGLPVLRRPDAVHLAVPRNRARRSTDARPREALLMHRENRAPWRTELVHALVAAARCLPRDEWLVPVDAALHRRLVSIDDVVAAGAAGGISASWIRRTADPRAESPAETRARIPMLDAGLAVASQVVIPRLGRADLVVEGRVVVEVDGETHHSSPSAVVEDKRRDRVATVGRYAVLRFPAAIALYDPDHILATVRELLGPQLGAP